MVPPAPEQNSSESDVLSEIELLSFHVGAHEYSVDIMSVREIRSWSRTTPLPHSPHYVSGVINLRGMVLPVVDLGLRLGLDQDEQKERSVIIVVDIAGRIIGLKVDAVSDILAVPVSQMRQPPDMSPARDDTFLKALTIVDERMVRVLDLASILPATAEDAA